MAGWFGTLRTEWYSNGVRWCPLGPQMVGQKPGVTTGLIQTAEQIIGQLGPFPAGLFDVGTVFKLRYSLGRSSNADAYGAATSIRMGPAGTVADAPIAGSNFSGVFIALGSSNSHGIENESRVASATSILRLGTANAGTSFNGASASGNLLNNASPVLDTTVNAMFVSISTGMAAATTTAPQTGYMDLWVMS